MLCTPPPASRLTSFTRSVRVVSSLATWGEAGYVQALQLRLLGGAHHRMHAIPLQRGCGFGDQQLLVRLKLERHDVGVARPVAAEVS